MTDKQYIKHLADQCAFIDEATKSVSHFAMKVAEALSKKPALPELKVRVDEAKEAIIKIYDEYKKHIKLAGMFKDCVFDMNNVSTRNDVDWDNVNNNLAALVNKQRAFEMEHNGAVQFLGGVSATIEYMSHKECK